MRRRAAVAAALLSGVGLAWAVAAGPGVGRLDAGLVRSVTGPAFVVTGARRVALAAGVRLQAGDTLAAGALPFRILFADNMTLTLEAGTSLTLSDEAFAETDDPGLLSAVLSQPARALTGYVWRKVGLKSRVRVPTASIGFRG